MEVYLAALASLLRLLFLKRRPQLSILCCQLLDPLRHLGFHRLECLHILSRRSGTRLWERASVVCMMGRTGQAAGG